MITETHEARQPLAQTAFIGMSRKEIESYSILRALRQISSERGLKDSLELDASRQVAKRTGKEAEVGERTFFIPQDILTAKLSRDLTTGIDPAGGYMVSDDLQSMIELLRNKTMVIQMGARVISDLIGNVKFPKQTGAGNTFWVAEGSSPTESQQSVGQVGVSPKTVGGYTDISRKLILQTGGGAERFVREDFASAIALAVDLAAINGSGVASEPLGIMNTSGIGSVAVGTNGGPPTYAHMINLETELAIDNADSGKLGYLTNQKVRGKLKQIEKASSTGQFVWENGQAPGEGLVNGYRAGVSNQIPSNLTKGSGTDLSAMIFANWDDLLIAEWGGLMVQVDPYSLATSGGIRVVVFKDVDIAVRHAESFSIMSDISTI